MPTELLQLQPPWLNAQSHREGRYVLGPLLGKGGMGEVVEAWDVVLCRTVALKVLRNMEPTALIRFMHEAQVQARVAHPNICRIYDVDSSEGTVKIAMQLVQGPNLEHAWRDLSVETVVSLVAEVAEAVHAAHCLKLIHRDLKPSNILLERGGNGHWTPYICDFGLAMALDEPALTYSNGILGTPAYMAPEQFHGVRSQIGPATDIYGLGGTLHFALRGWAPAGPTRDGKQHISTATASPDPARSTRPELPAELRSIIGKCLEEDPGLRYPSAAALAEDLRRFLKGEPVQATRPSSLRRLWHRNRPQFRVTLGSALVAGGLLAGWIIQDSYLERAHGHHSELVRLYDMEAADMERAVRLERMLPCHDLRPIYERIQARIQAIQARLQSAGAAARGPGHIALARMQLLLGHCRLAQEEAQAAWDSGLHGSEVAYLLASATGKLCLEAQTSGRPDPAAGATVQRLEALFQQGRGLETTPDDYPRALVAFLRKDYLAAAGLAEANARLRPWDADSAYLESISHCAIAQQNLDNGDLAGAEGECRAAMAVARHFLLAGRSDASAHHAYSLAARLLASILGDRGALTPALLGELQHLSSQALLLEPDSPDLQEDWLGVIFLTAMDLRERNLDPDPKLNEALVFLGTHPAAAPAAPLSSSRRQIYWQLAERHFDLGEATGPALAEALKDLEPAPLLRRDYLGPILNFKARAEAACGLDPGATVAGTLRRILPPPSQGRPSWAVCESAAEAWLILADWQAAHAQDASASLAQAEAFSNEAIQGNPNCASGQALNGLARVLEMRYSPGKGRMLRLIAQERLRAALALKASGRQQRRLKRSIQSLGSVNS